MKKTFENDLISGMQEELKKQASARKPNLVKAAECLHSALEILEGSGMQKSADKVLNLLEKIAQEHSAPLAPPKSLPLPQLMAAGLTQRDLREFSKGSLYSTAKINLVLRSLGMSDYDMSGVIGADKVMSEEEAQKIINPNETIELGSIAKKKFRNLNKQADESFVFDVAADDDLLDADIGDDLLEVFDKKIPLEDFEDE